MGELVSEEHSQLSEDDVLAGHIVVGLIDGEGVEDVAAIVGHAAAPVEQSDDEEEMAINCAQPSLSSRSPSTSPVSDGPSARKVSRAAAATARVVGIQKGMMGKRPVHKTGMESFKEVAGLTGQPMVLDIPRDVKTKEEKDMFAKLLDDFKDHAHPDGTPDYTSILHAWLEEHHFPLYTTHQKKMAASTNKSFLMVRFT